MVFISVYGRGGEKGEEVKVRFLEDLKDYLESFIPNKRVVVLGDLNAKVGGVPKTVVG